MSLDKTLNDIWRPWMSLGFTMLIFAVKAISEGCMNSSDYMVFDLNLFGVILKLLMKIWFKVVKEKKRSSVQFYHYFRML